MFLTDDTSENRGKDRSYHNRTFLLICLMQKSCIELKAVLAKEFTPNTSLAYTMTVTGRP